MTTACVVRWVICLCILWGTAQAQDCASLDTAVPRETAGKTQLFKVSPNKLYAAALKAAGQSISEADPEQMRFAYCVFTREYDLRYKIQVEAERGGARLAVRIIGFEKPRPSQGLKGASIGQKNFGKMEEGMAAEFIRRVRRNLR